MIFEPTPSMVAAAVAALQGTPEWHSARLGKLTASRMADVVRRTKTGESASRIRYLGELVAERLTGAPASSWEGTKDMQWGNAHEDDARSAYAFLMDCDPVPVGFVDHPVIPMAGASPDRLIGDDGLLEIKCPATHTHIATLMGAPIDLDYMTQMQWQMACTGRQWCDWVSYDPRMPPAMRLVVRRVARSEDRITVLEQGALSFLADVAETVRALNELHPTASTPSPG